MRWLRSFSDKGSTDLTDWADAVWFDRVIMNLLNPLNPLSSSFYKHAKIFILSFILYNIILCKLFGGRWLKFRAHVWHLHEILERAPCKKYSELSPFRGLNQGYCSLWRAFFLPWLEKRICFWILLRFLLQRRDQVQRFLRILSEKSDCLSCVWRYKILSPILSIQ